MKLIALTQGKFAKVDDEDYGWLRQWKWGYHNKGYAARTNRKILMHRVVLNVSENFQVDHINHDKLDNRRSNLRKCTSEQNNANSLISSRNTSGFKGVYWHKKARRWMAYISFKGQRYHLGLHEDLHQAALAYNSKAVEVWGEFAYLNSFDV